jgi:hypothetical protein
MLKFLWKVNSARDTITPTLTDTHTDRNIAKLRGVEVFKL